MSQSSASTHIDQRFTNLTITGTRDCDVPLPALDVYGGARFAKTVCMDNSLRIKKDLKIKGNLEIQGNTILHNVIADDLIVGDLVVEGNITGSGSINIETKMGIIGGPITSNGTLKLFIQPGDFELTPDIQSIPSSPSWYDVGDGSGHGSFNGLITATSGGSTYFTPQEDGRYMCIGSCWYDANSTGTRSLGLHVSPFLKGTITNVQPNIPAPGMIRYSVLPTLLNFNVPAAALRTWNKLRVTINGVNPNVYNLVNEPTNGSNGGPTSFDVTNGAVGAYVSGGTVEASGVIYADERQASSVGRTHCEFAITVPLYGGSQVSIQLRQNSGVPLGVGGGEFNQGYRFQIMRIA